MQKIFQQKTGLGVIEYFSHMKIDAAKQMMRTDFRELYADFRLILWDTPLFIIFQDNSKKLRE